MLASRGQTSPVVFGILALLLVMAPLFGLLVARVEPALAVGVVLGVIVFILTFVSVQFAIYVLIFATLLSPEFGSRTTGGGGVTIRLDDFLLLIIGFSQLTRSAVYRDVGIFAWSPLNRYITYYMLACVFSTGVGIIFGRVNPLTGFFFVLKYFEYFIVRIMEPFWLLAALVVAFPTLEESEETENAEQAKNTQEERNQAGGRRTRTLGTPTPHPAGGRRIAL